MLPTWSTAVARGETNSLKMATSPVVSLNVFSWAINWTRPFPVGFICIKGVDQSEDQSVLGEMTWGNREQYGQDSKGQRKLKDSGGGLLPAVTGHSLE